MGRRHRVTYRLNAMDQRSPRDGRVIEQLGIYDPESKDPTKGLTIDTERVAYWLSVGAQPSDTVRGLLRRAGMDVKLRPRPSKPPKPKAEEAKAAEGGEAAAPA
jgi:small subunit ribosomal protein S16